MDNRYEIKMSTESFLPYRMEYLTDWMVKKAKDELNETDENRDQAIVELRNLIASDKALDVWTDDAYLLQFLRARKFNVKRAWDLFHTFYTVKKDFPDVYPRDFDFDDLRKLGETNGAGAFNFRNKDGCVVLFIQAKHWDPNINPFQTIVIGLTFMALASVEYPATQVCGLHFIIDTKEFSWEQLRSITPRYVRLLSKGLRNTFPVRFKGIHIVNEPAVFTYFIKLLKMFLSEKIKRRIHFHGSDMENLHKYVSKEILPPEYGGDNTDYSGREWCKQELDLHIGRFKEMLCKGTDVRRAFGACQALNF